MIEFKGGVMLRFPLSPHLERIFVAFETLWRPAWGNPVVTAGGDGKHRPDSLHFKDRALDWRSKTIPTVDEKRRFREALAGWLGPEYDVLLEGLGSEGEHYHVERDPKKARSSV